MPSMGRDDPNGHISVYWLNDTVAPSRWDLWSQRWRNLPAALWIALVVFFVIVPKPSVSVPMPSFPDASVPGWAADPGEPVVATPTARPVTIEKPQTTLASLFRSRAMASSTGSSLPELVTTSATPPNELGGVPIIMYHAFVHNEENTDEWTLTYDQFREHLDWFRDHDFVMVGMQSMVDGRFDVPAGKRPIVLTFDDSSSGQFGLHEAEGGCYEVEPETAVGILEEYRSEYPDFAGPAFFAVLPWKCFASDDDPSSCEERLNWLVEHDYEVGNHTCDHVDMTDVSAEFFTESIDSMEVWINALIPEGKGNLSDVLVMPFGAFPDANLHGDQRSWLADGFWYLGEPVNLELVLAVNGGPAISPYSDSFYPAETYRIASDPQTLGYWQERITSGETPIFVSDGNPDIVTVPASAEKSVDEDALNDMGLVLRVYGDRAKQN